ncbi:glutathione S-transferase family protein [Vannielia litorea]|uniref:glutathione S-transferase family protein n=1 Tax=Vannielia litorea TaxID=1217970 RepID=UPI001C945351|nr:glutathione S-transferase family protein [Vannielia litorea]MBY6046926.1 glutathione S-transferase family protein [Vannielia litorea]MBY6074340.1 glutathione S-transferase family protein [Vannielia litorea]
MIRLHHCHQTRSMRVLWLLHELGIDFDLVVHPFDKSLRAPGYLALNPAGRVPALEIDGDVWWESGAIVELLCERFAEAGLGRAPGAPERAEWLIWVHFAETISQHLAALTQQHIMLYDDTMRSPVVMKLEAARLGKCFEALNRRLEGRETLLDGGFSAADVAVGQAVYMGQRFAPVADYPALAAWWARVSGREAFKASLPPEGADLLYKEEFYAPW